MDKISLAQLQSTVARPLTVQVDRYKLGLVLIAEGVFNAPNNNVGIQLGTLSIADDLDVFFATLGVESDIGVCCTNFGVVGQEYSKRSRGARRRRLLTWFTAFPLLCRYGPTRRSRRFGHVLGSELVKECHDFLAGQHENSHSIVHTIHFSRTYSCMCTPHFVPPMQRLNNPIFPHSCRTMIPRCLCSMILPGPLSCRNSMHRTLTVERVDNRQGRVPMIEFPVDEVVRMKHLEMTMETGSLAVIARVMILRIPSRASTINPAMVRILAEGRQVRLPCLGRHELLLQCEDQRWKHEQLEHLDQA
ncbi:Hypothetical predicted protein [Olea europaea subsp. europaea]|uniref:Uncharacterized protein n=1 Tax=Olea europaea subsp. europaea TaxID=158383 RepID=A0A8S0SYX1_OLEEU|nr:Hypothetical predicted protein [Olea europaea subsp. europaea]